MREATAADYHWLNQHDLRAGFCLTYVQGVDEHEKLRHFGANPDTLRPMTLSEAIEIDFEHGGGECVVALTRRFDNWTVVIEPNGWAGTTLGVLLPLSTGTTAISVQANINGDRSFNLAENGELLTSFDPLFPERRGGSQPDVLVPLMNEVGIIRSNDREDQYIPLTEASLALADRISGTQVTAAALEGTLLGGILGPH
ncbi:DUF6461 domain-containing protein [Frankia gtarii]|uniref:DUF6461 domain-containing protein n=1 Tax=Frankia gtarii TaxID=2950102 RepID=UPI0021BF39CB|nr:DUF6461 domain-containing protein [Frankia gtarii]